MTPRQSDCTRSGSQRARGGPLATLALAVAALLVGLVVAVGGQVATVQFVFTSDVHYGITRKTFQGRSNVDAHVVNAAMIAKMNTLADTPFPADGGLRAGENVGALDFVAVGGDIANREEATSPVPIQSAARSWAQFASDYLEGLRLAGPSGERAPVYVVPGNHDVSNAIGHYARMVPPTDKTSMVEIYNRMMTPLVPRVATTYSYPRDKVLVSHDVGGVHFMFITMWPDSSVRAWMDEDLARVGPTTPAIVFTHDQPESEAKHFINPNGVHDINTTDRFENLLADRLADGGSTRVPTTIEQRAFERFIERHPNVTAYFHGNSNWNQFYQWTGPDKSVDLHTFRVDSPMKGAVSATDERRLSFQVATIDVASRRMTVRECLWNVDPSRPQAPLAWGNSTTVTLSTRPSAVE